MLNFRRLLTYQGSKPIHSRGKERGVYRRTSQLGLAILLIGLVSADQASGAWRNGKRFDPGTAMTERAPGAPEQLDRVTGFLGQWDVEVKTFSGEAEPKTARGQAEITFINRGHALMESFYSDDYDGHRYASVYFLGYNPASESWFLGGADNWTERAWVADGSFEDKRLVLTDTQRRRGGVGRTEIRYSFEQESPDTLSVTTAESTDRGTTFRKTEHRTYRRRTASPEFMQPESTYGSPTPDRPAEAGAFDFLIGEWNESHQMTFPNGQQAQWASNGTGVFALHGAAVLEYTWFDVDPNLPDAATTILRLYNRGMRRWESLYVPNRGHSILYFGGRQEGDEIVLGNFETHAAAAPISRYVFHSIGEDSYAWYSEQTTDRGATWAKNWIIDVERKPSAEAPEVQDKELLPSVSPARSPTSG